MKILFITDNFNKNLKENMSTYKFLNKKNPNCLIVGLLRLWKRTFTFYFSIMESLLNIVWYPTLKFIEYTLLYNTLQLIFDNSLSTGTIVCNKSIKQKQIILNYYQMQKFVFFSYSKTFDDILVNKLLLTKNTNEIQLSYSDINLESYRKNEEKMLQLIDNQFWKEVTTKKSFFYSNCDLYEFSSILPFERSLKLNDIFYVNLNWLSFFSFNDNLATYDLASSFYFEPFFFFWEKIQQSMLEFRMISHYRAWALLFDDWVYKPNILVNDPNHIFPSLSHLSHTSDFKAGYKILKRLFDYKNNNKFSYYLEFEDTQNYAFDKNFVHLWNYWIGTYSPLNIFDSWGWTGIINFFRERISSPKLHFESKFYWTDNSYGSYSTWVIQFAFFPDFAMLWGQFNPQFDRMTSGYNRFFHFGENFIDSSIALDLIRFQLTENYWGDFEYIVEDYSAYQATYFPDNIATIRIPIILLATKNYPSPSEMTIWINDYNNVFMFKQIKQYENLWTDIFFDLDWLTWLELLRDGPPIDQWVFHLEKVINCYFGYNTSTFIANQPSWLNGLTDPYDFYSTLVYDTNEDLKLEDREWNLISSLWSINYDYSSNPSIYFTTNNSDYKYFNLPKFLNEKIFDDSGYFNSSINRGSEYINNNRFNWLSKFSLIHIEYLPISHFNWKITILGSNPLEWDFLLPYYDKINFSKIITAIKESFWFEYLILSYPMTFEYKDELYLVTTKLPTFYFEFNFQPLIVLFWDFAISSPTIQIFEYFLHKIMHVLTCIFPLYNFITIDNFNQKLDFIFNKLSNLDNFYLNTTLLHLKSFANLPLIKFLNQKLDFIFNKLSNLDNFYLNTTLLYLKSFADLPLIKFLNQKLNLFFDYLIQFLFSYEHFDVQIHLYKADNNDQIKIALDRVNISIKPMPLEFYLPLFKYPKSAHLIEWVDSSIKIADKIILPDLTLLSTTDNVAMERFITYWSLILLSNENIWSENLEDVIKIINQLDYNSLKNKSIDYDWYINYVIKKTLYKKNN